MSRIVPVLLLALGLAAPAVTPACTNLLVTKGASADGSPDSAGPSGDDGDAATQIGEGSAHADTSSATSTTLVSPPKEMKTIPVTAKNSRQPEVKKQCRQGQRNQQASKTCRGAPCFPRRGKQGRGEKHAIEPDA